MGFESCCGQTPKKRTRRVQEKLPPNPDPPGGVPVIYLGSGYAKVEGKVSGLTYILADYRRHFSAHQEDVPSLLRSPDFILQP
jgi:hypothetical protein